MVPAVAFVWIPCATGAWAQEVVAPAPAWGTTVESVRTVSAWGGVPITNAVSVPAEWDYYGSNSLYRYRLGGTTNYGQSLELPSGALITRYEAEACDESASQFLQFEIARCPKSGGPCVFEITLTGVAATPGCGVFATTLATPWTVDNASFSYGLMFATNATSSAIRWRAMSIYYKLQVSPAPATATFADVPTTSPYFKFVEALYAAGIVSGCGGGNYCPSNAVTRAQMAVFLCVALGLHWAP
jgi:hypothetical protein